jgi:DNA mismatch repair protein MutS2
VTTLVQMRKTASELDWPRLLERVAAFCQSEAGARSVLALLPETSFELARERMERTREALALVDVAALPAAPRDDREPALDALARGDRLDARTLLGLSQLLERRARLAQYLERHASQAPHLGAWLATAPELARLEQLLEHCIGADGSLLDQAAPELASARRGAHAARDQLRQRLGELLDRLAPALSGQYLAERDGRFVLPVRADAPFRVDGLVLGSSASGSTLYVEPRETHELGNRLQVAQARVRAEEARVLDLLNAALAAELDRVRQAHAALVEADVLRAIALYGKEHGALALLPEPIARLDLKQMRHPLLLGGSTAVVANDLVIEAGRAVIVSGPNAGGKTVALECFGLAAWMARTGLPIVAAPGSSVGWFETVLTDIGDHQSLMHSLSTFSAHVATVADALARASSATLVLIDELGGGTDPDEGAALAVAVVEALVARGAAVCVTTHHERLKAFAAEHPCLTNAAVGFDRERLAPTFALEYGAPGASSALSVAERFGIEGSVIARAAELLPEGVIAGRALLRELDEQRSRLASASAEADAERERAAALTRELTAERQRRASQERGRLSLETETVLEEVQRARVRLREAETRLGRGSDASAALVEARRATNELARFVAIGGALRETIKALEPAPEPLGPPVSWAELAVGAAVTLPAMGATGTVLSKPRRDQVTVAIGAIKTTVGIEALSLTSPSADAPRAKSAALSRASAQARPAHRAIAPAAGRSQSALATAAEPMRTRQNTLVLVGERVESALERLDAFIDGVLRESEPYAFVVHGHGTGALRSAVREHLGRHPNVRRHAPASRDDGGDALTVFWLG